MNINYYIILCLIQLCLIVKDIYFSKCGLHYTNYQFIVYKIDIKNVLKKPEYLSICPSKSLSVFLSIFICICIVNNTYLLFFRYL